MKAKNYALKNETKGQILQHIMGQYEALVIQKNLAPQENKVTLFMGNTKAGKSTIVNYLLGNRLVSKWNVSEYKDYLAQTDSNSRGPKIGLSSVSETTVPNKYMSINNEIIYDLPSFDDTRGPVQDITNAFYLRSLINSSSAYKLVLVSDFNDIRTGGNSSFLNMLKRINDLFPNVDDILSGVSIIFTKYTDTAFPVSYDVVIPNMLRKIVSTTSIEPESKKLVQHFIDNPKYIATFNAPTGSDVIYQIAEDDHIANTIANASYLSTATHSDGFPFSQSSIEFLMENYHEFREIKDFDPLLTKITKAYQRVIKKIGDYINITDIEDAKIQKAEDAINKIEKMLHVSQEELSITDEFKIIYNIFLQISKINKEIHQKISIEGVSVIDEMFENLKINKKLVNFTEKILSLEHTEISQLFIDKLEYKLSTIVAPLIKKAKISIEIAKNQLKLNKTKEDQQINQDQIKNIESEYARHNSKSEDTNKDDTYIFNTVIGAAKGAVIGGGVMYKFVTSAISFLTTSIYPDSLVGDEAKSTPVPYRLAATASGALAGAVVGGIHGYIEEKNRKTEQKQQDYLKAKEEYESEKEKATTRKKDLESKLEEQEKKITLCISALDTEDNLYSSDEEGDFDFIEASSKDSSKKTNHEESHTSLLDTETKGVVTEDVTNSSTDNFPRGQFANYGSSSEYPTQITGDVESISSNL